MQRNGGEVRKYILQINNLHLQIKKYYSRLVKIFKKLLLTMVYYIDSVAKDLKRVPHEGHMHISN